MAGSVLTKEELLLKSELVRYGHTLGIDLNYGIGSTGHAISSKGNLLPLSMTILSELFDSYAQEYPDALNEKIAALITAQTDLEMVDLSFGNAVADFNINGIYSSLFNRYKKNNLSAQQLSHAGVSLIPLSLENHGFYIAFNDQYIAISNRGKNFSQFGTKIYKLKPGAAAQLQQQNFASKGFKTIKECEDYFFQFAESDPEVSFEFRPQKMGNCSFANFKSLLKPLMYMYGVKDQQEIFDRYKDFTSWAREHEVKSLIKKYKLAKSEGNKDYAELYEDLIKAYMARHELKVSVIEQVFAASKGILGGLLSFLEDGDVRKDIKTTTSEGSKLRRHDNIAIIYKELKDDPNFADVFLPIAAEVAKITPEESVINDYPVELPKRLPHVVVRDEKETQAFQVEIKIVLYIAILVAPIMLIGMALSAISKAIFGSSDHDPHLASSGKQKTNVNKAESEPGQINEEAKAKSYIRHRKYYLNSKIHDIKATDSKHAPEPNEKSKNRLDLD